MVHRRVLLAFCLLALSDAFIRYEKSMIYDEFDFAGQKSISVPLRCTDAGCRIYISMPEASRTIANNLMIAEKVTLRTRFSDVALMKQLDGQKGFYSIRKGNQFVNFTNQNTDLKSAPIMLWIVQNDAPNINDVQVYDAALFYRTPARAGLVTIMNTEPFTLTTDTRGPMTVTAKLAGFDLFDSDECATVFQQDDPSTYQELALSVRSPLITLLFDGVNYPDTTVAMTAKVELVYTFNLNKPTFATSPGYVCTFGDEGHDNGTISFRSSLYESTTEYRFVAESPIEVKFYEETNAPQDNPVVTTDHLNGAEYKWWSSSSDAEAKELCLDLFTDEVSISWNRPDNNVDEYFLVRVVPISKDNSRTTTASDQTTSPEATTIGVDSTSAFSTDDKPVNSTAATRRTMPPTSPKMTSSRPLLSTSSASHTTSSQPKTTTSSAKGAAVLGCFVMVIMKTFKF